MIFYISLFISNLCFKNIIWDIITKIFFLIIFINQTIKMKIYLNLKDKYN